MFFYYQILTKDNKKATLQINFISSVKQFIEDVKLPIKKV